MKDFPVYLIQHPVHLFALNDRDRLFSSQHNKDNKQKFGCIFQNRQMFNK